MSSQISSQESFLSSGLLNKDEQAMIFEDPEVKTFVDLWNPDISEHLMGLGDELSQNMNGQNNLMQDIKPSLNVLSNEEYAGPYNFEVSIYPNGVKNPWVYSPKLNKIFMDMSVPFPVDFRININPPFPLFIRATPVFCLPQHIQENVYRCICHEHEADSTNTGVDAHVRQHVIRCNTNSSARYEGIQAIKERLSVVIPLHAPQTGTDSVREMFVFMCKNSCPAPGMNRKPIEVIFTLENMNKEILGRKVLMVRICSCPKRDKEKEEKEADKSSDVPRGKKRKIDDSKIKQSSKHVNNSSNDDRKEYTTVSIIGKKNYLKVLEICQALNAAEVLKSRDNGLSDLQFRNSMNTNNSLINKYKVSE